MSDALLRCHFCAWQHHLGVLDDPILAASMHQAHLAQHVEDLLRTAFLPYDTESFITEPTLTLARSTHDPSHDRHLRRCLNRSPDRPLPAPNLPTPSPTPPT